MSSSAGVQEIVGGSTARVWCRSAGRFRGARFRHNEIPENMPEVSLPVPGCAACPWSRCFCTGLTASNDREAVRMIEQGGFKLNGERLSDRPP
jgi:tyrosyl-tRNA synthetase